MHYIVDMVRSTLELWTRKAVAIVSRYMLLHDHGTNVAKAQIFCKGKASSTLGLMVRYTCRKFANKQKFHISNDRKVIEPSPMFLRSVMTKFIAPKTFPQSVSFTRI